MRDTQKRIYPYINPDYFNGLSYPDLLQEILERVKMERPEERTFSKDDLGFLLIYRDRFFVYEELELAQDEFLACIANGFLPEIHILLRRHPGVGGMWMGMRRDGYSECLYRSKNPPDWHVKSIEVPFVVSRDGRRVL
jgi:hypothetical protein